MNSKELILTFDKYETLNIDGKAIDLSSYYDESILKNANYLSPVLSNFKNPFTNTFFKSFIHDKILVYKNLIKSEEVTYVLIDKITDDSICLIIACKEVSIKYKFKKIKLLIKSLTLLKDYVSFIISFIYVFYKLILSLGKIKKDTRTKKNVAAIIQSNTSLNAIKENIIKVDIDDLDYYYDPLTFRTEKGISIYTAVNFFNFISITCRIFYDSIKNYYTCIAEYNSLYELYALLLFNKYLCKRIVHYEINKCLIESIVLDNNYSVIISGEKESRWGVLLNRVASSFKIKSISIPHGLHYSIKYPHGIYGQHLVCNTNIEKKVLSKLYSNKSFCKAFIFSDLQLSNLSFGNIVYFTEGRDAIVDLKIIEKLSFHFEILIKLHPNDRVDIYKDIDKIIFIEDFDQAIRGNICISRNSTVLLQALGNESAALSILINSKDKYISDCVYPALSDQRIKKFNTIQGLISYLKNETNHSRS